MSVVASAVRQAAHRAARGTSILRRKLTDLVEAALGRKDRDEPVVAGRAVARHGANPTYAARRTRVPSRQEVRRSFKKPRARAQIREHHPASARPHALPTTGPAPTRQWRAGGARRGPPAHLLARSLPHAGQDRSPPSELGVTCPAGSKPRNFVFLRQLHPGDCRHLAP